MRKAQVAVVKILVKMLVMSQISPINLDGLAALKAIWKATRTQVAGFSGLVNIQSIQ